MEPYWAASGVSKCGDTGLSAVQQSTKPMTSTAGPEPLLSVGVGRAVRRYGSAVETLRFLPYQHFVKLVGFGGVLCLFYCYLLYV